MPAVVSRKLHVAPTLVVAVTVSTFSFHLFRRDFLQPKENIVDETRIIGAARTKRRFFRSISHPRVFSINLCSSRRFLLARGSGSIYLLTYFLFG